MIKSTLQLAKVTWPHPTGKKYSQICTCLHLHLFTCKLLQNFKNFSTGVITWKTFNELTFSLLKDIVLDIIQTKHLVSFLDLSGSGSESSKDIESHVLEKVMTGKMSAFNRVNLALKLNKDGTTPVMKEAFEKLDEVVKSIITEH